MPNRSTSHSASLNPKKLVTYFTNNNYVQNTVKDINKMMPKLPNMKWGALLNRLPTSEKVDQMNKIFPNNGKWHTVFEEEDQVFVDGIRVWKKDTNAWT